MGTGSLTRSITAKSVRFVAFAALATLPTFAAGQHYMPAPCPDGSCGPGGHYGAMHDGGFNGPMPMGAGGTSPPVGYDLMNDVGVEGSLVDQRGPHYFDARLEAVFLGRDDTFTTDITFSRVGSGADADAPGVEFLRSDELDYDAEAGFRVMGRYDICPLAVFEFGYMGIYDYESSASVEAPLLNLFSLFSRPAPGTGNFGTDPIPPEVPPPGVDVTGGPMPQTERSALHTISLDSQLQSAELSYRRYWLGFTPRISGTLLAGFRYTRLDENFNFHTEAPARTGTVGGVAFADPAAEFNYLLEAENHLAGLQTGGDVWIGLSQGLRFGTECKFGIYNNHYTLNNVLTANPADVVGRPFSTLLTNGESFNENQPAFTTELSIDLVADILPSWSFRVGYEVLFINSIVLAGENFNQVSPFGNQGARVPFANDQGDALYQGGHMGLEFIW